MEKEFAKGLLRMSLEVEWETRGDLRRRLTSSSQQVLLCSYVPFPSELGHILQVISSRERIHRMG